MNNSIKISIKITAKECYLYLGQLFFVDKNNVFSSIEIFHIVRELESHFPQYAKFLRLAFLRNDYLYNKQGKFFWEIPDVKNTFIRMWETISYDRELIFEIPEEMINKLIEIPVATIYDIKMYGMRSFIGTKSGLYESSIIMDNNKTTLTAPQRVFDCKVINIQAKSGSIFASSNSEGLFYGELNGASQMRMRDKPIAAKSIRTNWSNYDLFNYSDNSDFIYIDNEVTRENKPPLYSWVDENKERYKFSRIAQDKVSKETLLERSKIEGDKIIYSFNSASVGFFFLNDGSFVTNGLDKKEGKVRFTSRNNIWNQANTNELNKPLSSHITPNGCMVEYHNNLILYQNGQNIYLENEPCVAIKSYPASLRYKNVISVLKDDHISLHALFPFARNYAKGSLFNPKTLLVKKEEEIKTNFNPNESNIDDELPF
jgi:hypothetical protein